MQTVLQGFQRSVNINRLSAKETHQTVAETFGRKEAGVSHTILASRDNQNKILQPPLEVYKKTMNFFFSVPVEKQPC